LSRGTMRRHCNKAHSVRRAAAAVVVLWLALGWCMVAAAADDEAKVTVKEILASKEKKDYVDPKLKEVARQLGKMFKYNVYKLHATHMRKLKVNEKTDMLLTDGYKLNVKLLDVRGDGKDRKVQLQLTVSKRVRKGNKTVYDKIGQIKFRVQNRVYFLLGCGRTRSGFLILGITGE